MLLDITLLYNYCPYLSINDALKLEETSSKFKTINKYRYIASRALVQYICNFSQIKFTFSLYNNIYDILYSLHLLDYTIFIVGSANKLTDMVSRICSQKHEIEYIFSHRLPSNLKLYSDKLIYNKIRVYVSKLNYMLSNPKIMIINFLANKNPEYFTSKYGISCSETITIDLYQEKEFNNIIVCLHRILPYNLWSNSILQEVLLCFNTINIKKNKLLNYPENNLLIYMLKKMFDYYSKRIIKTQLREAFDKLSYMSTS